MHIKAGRRAVATSLAVGLVIASQWIGAREVPVDNAGDAVAAPALPDDLTRNDRYATSAECRACHPDEYASWHRSFHRTMTQVASDQNFVGKFDGTTIDSNGLKYRVFKKEDQFWAEMPDPDEMMDRQATYDAKQLANRHAAPPRWDDLPQVERKVVMSTGSHHYQTYWVESDRYPGTLMTLPLVWLIEDQRWIPREAAFMYPPNSHRMVTVWNDHCIKCHSTGPVPAPFAEMDRAHRKVLETGFRSRVGELGIACEACHGPGSEHIRLHRADASIEAGSIAGNDSSNHVAISRIVDPIVHPGQLADHERSAQICGQCHGAYIFEGQAALRFRDNGSDYLPGQDLFATRHYIFPPQEDQSFYTNLSERSRAYKEYVNNREFFRQRFWEDGQVLAGGCEFTGLALSACYRRGDISCLSCHTLHSGDPNDQLIAPESVDKSCIACHNEDRFQNAIQTHTHHLAGSSGSSCVNCHMPHTTYALFSAIRNHYIASPKLASNVARGAPNACNLCHLDKTLAWTADQLATWYDFERPKLAEEQRSVPTGLLWMLKGDAARRVIVAWHVGYRPTQEASGTDWMAPVVAHLLADPYGVVRYVAARSLRTLPGFANLDYDFLAPTTAQEQTKRDVIATWRGRQPLANPKRNSNRNPMERMLNDATLQRLLSGRDNRPVTIQE